MYLLVYLVAATNNTNPLAVEFAQEQLSGLYPDHSYKIFTPGPNATRFYQFMQFRDQEDRYATVIFGDATHLHNMLNSLGNHPYCTVLVITSQRPVDQQPPASDKHATLYYSMAAYNQFCTSTTHLFSGC